MSYTVTGVVTQLIKVRQGRQKPPINCLLAQMCVGRPRPDLIARCQPLAGSVDRPVYGLSTIDICTSENVLRLADGFKVSSGHLTLALDRAEHPQSFPSGHSSRECPERPMCAIA